MNSSGLLEEHISNISDCIMIIFLWRGSVSQFVSLKNIFTWKFFHKKYFMLPGQLVGGKSTRLQMPHHIQKCNIFSPRQKPIALCYSLRDQL